MYDMTRVNANGYFDTLDEDKRYQMLKDLNKQRNEDFKNKTYAIAQGLPDKLTGDEVWFVKEYFDYYKTKRGFHKRSINSTSGWNITSSLGLINAPILVRSNEIRTAVLMIHGEKAHSKYFSEDAFKNLKGDNKELYIVPDATHVDLYDNKNNKIPFDKIEDFLKKNL